MSVVKIINPTTITSAMLTSSTVLDISPGEVAWNPGTAYIFNDIAIRVTTGRKYLRLISGTTATPPENDPTNWEDIESTNKWAMFDRKVGSSTQVASPLTVVMRPGGVSGVGMLELVGREVVITLKDAPAGTVVYTKTIDLDGSVIESIYDWFFAEYEQRTDFAVSDLPQHFLTGELTVSITGTSDVSCGVTQVGPVIEVGRLLSGASVGIADYSSKNTDKYGNLDVEEGAFSKRNNMQILIKHGDFNKLFRLFASLRATPFIFIGSESIGMEPFLSYCFYKDFSIAVPYLTHHLCNLETEGLI